MTYNNVSSSWNISRDFGLKKATPYLREFSLSYSHTSSLQYLPSVDKMELHLRIFALIK